VKKILTLKVRYGLHWSTFRTSFFQVTAAKAAMDLMITIGYSAMALVIFFGFLQTRGFKFLSPATFTGSLGSRTWLRYRPLIAAFVVGCAWTLLHAFSAAFIIWIAKRLRSWCKKTIFTFSGENVTNYVAFTIDDAPGRGEPLATEVLDLLKINNSKCTFFIIASQVTKGPKEEFLRRCILDGEPNQSVAASEHCPLT
jgi:hypothetical protein